MDFTPAEVNFTLQKYTVVTKNLELLIDNTQVDLSNYTPVFWVKDNSTGTKTDISSYVTLGLSGSIQITYPYTFTQNEDKKYKHDLYVVSGNVPTMIFKGKLEIGNAVSEVTIV
jgi:hypothetical protein